MAASYWVCSANRRSSRGSKRSRPTVAGVRTSPPKGSSRKGCCSSPCKGEEHRIEQRRAGMTRRGKTAIVAVGGNALIVDDQHQSIPDQYKAAAVSSRYVADMVEAGVTVILTHGNGPQVGFILRRSGIAKGVVPEVPVDYADADTQGAIGYMFQRALHNEFKQRGLKRKVVAVVTQVLVDGNDPALTNPTKPIGAHMDEEIAKSLAAYFGWVVKEDAGRGWRRVVGSPKPK